jgi:hypothetical protein
MIFTHTFSSSLTKWNVHKINVSVLLRGIWRGRMACVISVQLRLSSLHSPEYSQDVSNMPTCKYSGLQQAPNPQPQTTNMLHQPHCYKKKKEKQQRKLLLILHTWSKLVSLMEKVWWVCVDRPLEQPLPDEQELLPESESESLQLHEPLSEPCTQLHTSGSQSSRMLVKCVSYHNKVLTVQIN